MTLFKKNTQVYETLPDQITSNPLITSWHSIPDGAFAYLVVNASAKSAESEERFWRMTLFAFAGCWVGGVAVKHILLGLITGISPSGAAWLGFWVAFVAFAFLVACFARFRQEKRICTVTSDQLVIERHDDTLCHALNLVVGIQRQAIDQQKIDKERRRFRKQREPKLKLPFSAELMLETVLGQVSLGAVFGLEEARNIADALNTAIQFMKGRTATGAGPVVDPRFQYKGKSAGQIPD